MNAETICYSKIFYTIGEVKLSKLRTCGSICSALSVLLFVLLVLSKNTLNVLIRCCKENRKLKPVLITLTVKNGSDLAERSEHLMKSFRTLLDRRRDYEKKGRGFNEFCKVQGLCTLTRIHTTKKNS